MRMVPIVEEDMRALDGEGLLTTTLSVQDASGLEEGDVVTLKSGGREVQAFVMWHQEVEEGTRVGFELYGSAE